VRLYIAVQATTLTDRFALEALARVRSRSCIIDGEARWCSAMPASSDSKASCANARAPYRSGRSPDWLKIKNPDGPTVKREATKGDWDDSRPSACRSS
jgi:hypothetical protein